MSHTASILKLSLLASALMAAGPALAVMAPDQWEILESPLPIYADDTGEIVGYNVHLTVNNLSLSNAITAFAVGVAGVNDWAYTTRRGWQPYDNNGIHHAETWDYDYKQYFGGMSWNDFIAGQTRADGSSYNWFAIYYNESGSGIAAGESASQFSYRTDVYPASPAAIGVTDSNGDVVGFTGSTTMVPEPETWAMLLAGCGLVGWRLRKPRRAEGGGD